MNLTRGSLLLLLTVCAAPACAQQTPARGAQQPAVGAAVPLDSVVARAERSRSKGAVNAPVTLVEISDFQCPFCREFAVRTLPALDSAYIRTGKLRMLYVNMPLPMHAHAWGAAEAALCAGAQDAFWPMHDRLFAAQDEWSRAENPTERFVAYAAALQLDMAAFRRCVDEDQVARVLVGDLMQATQNRINSTPTFVLNETEVLTGALPFAEFQKRIEAALAAPRP